MEIIGGYGPGSIDQLNISVPLSQLILETNRYIAELSIWKQYLIWRYTIGSGSVNKELIGIADQESKVIWTYQFFKYYNQKVYGIDKVERPFQKYKGFFLNAKKYLALRDTDKIKIASEVIGDYIRKLQEIILKAPVTQGSITVYKVSSEYPELPSKNNFIPKEVFQKPFNSTSINPQFNFNTFIMEDADCCFFVINIPKGSHVLYIPPIYHAYPFENEVLLPFGSTFNIYGHIIEPFNYISNNDIRILKVQNEPYVIAEVYELDPRLQPNIKTKEMNIFQTKLITPK